MRIPLAGGAKKKFEKPRPSLRVGLESFAPAAIAPEYFDTDGKAIRDEQRLLRIKRLAIPPAYTDVWICPSANGHIQAMGRDARRREQYRYQQRWRAARRDENKLISRSR